MSSADSPLATEKVLVLGASSQIGWYLLPRLLATGARVLALSRRAPPAGMLAHPRLHWLKPSAIEAELPACTALVSAGPLALAARYAKEMRKLAAMSLTSSSSVLVKGASPNPAERKMIATVRGAEDAVLALARVRGPGVLLLRPTLLYGCGLDRNISLLDRFICRFRGLPVARQANGLRQPLHVDDLAAALVRGLQLRAGAVQLSPLCGGETLSYRAMAERIFQARDLPPRLVPVPGAILAGALDLAGRSGLVAGANGEMVRRQALDLVFDDEPLRAQLQLTPRAFNPGERDFRPPTLATQQRLADSD